jgi:hypothetical protein
MTKRYAHLAAEHLNDAVQRLSPKRVAPQVAPGYFATPSRSGPRSSKPFVMLPWHKKAGERDPVTFPAFKSLLT